jgi:putative methionine-R-sulfoxide reductase with GAF domain
MEFTGPKPAGPSRQTKPLIERRGSVRLVVHSPAYTSLGGSSPEKACDLSEIVDLGEGGMSIQTSSPLEVGRNLNLCLDLSETKSRIDTSGSVVWSNGAGRAGISFPKLTGQSLSQLRQWFFVNVLTAFDHARGGASAAEDDARTSTTRSSLALGAVAQSFPNGGPRKELPTRAQEPVRGNLAHPNAGASAVQTELEAGGYDRASALQLIAERALTLTRATGCGIALSSGGEMICEASAGSDAPPLGTRLQASSGFSGECVRTGRCLRCDDSETDDRVDRGGCRALGVRSIVAVPIRRGNRVAGLLEVFSSHPYAFTPEDISVLQQLTGTVTSVMGSGVEISSAPAELSKAPPNLTRTPRVEARFAEAEALPNSGVLAGTVASLQSSRHPSMHKLLLAAALLTFLFALSWLIAPWILSRIGLARSNPPQSSPSRSSSRVQESQAADSRPPSVSAEVSDLAGLRKLAEQGDPAAQFALGARYATGEEVTQDYTEAVRWFALAADRGHILAQATLGAYYWAGRGVSPDMTKAYFWSALAQAGGDQASKYRVAVLSSRMSRSQILAAQEQASAWLRNHQMAGNTPATQ